VNTLRHTWYMVGRQARNLQREPIWIVLLLMQPMVWLVLYGQLFKHLPRLGGFGTNSYVTFLAPGIVVMNAFFGASWSGMAMITDLDRGVVERFLASPASRLALVVSQIVRAGATAVIQGLIILVIATLLGARVDAGVLGWLAILAAGFFVAAVFGGISQGMALLFRREATMIAAANFVSLPLFFLSPTLLAQRQMPEWMQTAATFNPVTWGVKAAREPTLAGTDWGSVGLHLALLVAAAAATTGFATWAFRSYRRSL
jgi:ABC-2 type transport system permease protein